MGRVGVHEDAVLKGLDWTLVYYTSIDSGVLSGHANRAASTAARHRESFVAAMHRRCIGTKPSSNESTLCPFPGCLVRTHNLAVFLLKRHPNQCHWRDDAVEACLLAPFFDRSIAHVVECELVHVSSRST
jgi:hypothetical protein